jgi:bifunctional enzyme CysN/CysC
MHAAAAILAQVRTHAAGMANSSYEVTRLASQEAAAIHIMREVAAESERPVLLFSGGKGSILLLRLAEKAFRPARFPFVLMHVDAGRDSPEVLEFLDRRAAELGERLIVANGLRRAVAEGRFDAVIDGRRACTPTGRRYESWDIYSGRVRSGEHVCVSPICDWTERDVWEYIRDERLELPSSYVAPRSTVIHRNEMHEAERVRAAGPLLRIVTAGAVDDGKSTLVGRLLELSLPPGYPRGEREQAEPVDVGYWRFASPRRAFNFADIPGDVRYARNLLAEASTADLALIVIDAGSGVVSETRRHLFIASLLRIPHVIVCVNKMDLVDYREDTFEAICAEVSSFAPRLELHDISFTPVSALRGDNVVEPSDRMPWYGGSPLLSQLERLQIGSQRNLIDVRLPIQSVIRPAANEQHGDRRYAGQMASGVLRVGDEVRVLPSGQTSTVTAIANHEQSFAEAYPPLSVSVALADDLNISRGDLICRPRNRPGISREIDAIVWWLGESPSAEQGRYLVKHTTQTVQGILSEVVHRIDVDSLRHDVSVGALGLNEVGRVRLRTRAPLLFDPYDRNRSTGSIILIDESTTETVAAGMILGSATPPPSAGALGHQRSANVTWNAGRLERDVRWRALGCVGATVWMTGLPAAGKSTISAALEEWLVNRGISALRLDGDNLRHGLNGDLGFDPADRAENVRRTAHTARLVAEAGTVAIVSLVSPYAADRRLAREIHETDGVQFLEVFIDTPLQECERRDPKGLYARARAGELHGLTGVDDVYERPAEPELRLAPGDVAGAVGRLTAELRARAIIR